MELMINSLSLALAILIIISIFSFGLLKRVNDWYYGAKLGNAYSTLPPGDMGWPILGCSIPIYRALTKAGPDSFVDNLVSKYGKVDMFKTHLFGSPGVIVWTSEICRQVLMDDESFMPGAPTSIRLISGRKSLINVTKSEHKRLRHMTAAPVSGHESLAMYIDHIEHLVINGLEEWASMKEPIEFLTEVNKLTFKIIWNIFMGSTSYESSSSESFEKLYSTAFRGLLSLPINIPGFNFHKSLVARKKIATVLQSIIDRKRLSIEKDEGKQKKDMMDLLMEVEDEDGKKLEDECIIDLIFGYLVAGHETSASATMWTVICLMDHPQIYSKAKEEQENIIKKRPSTQKGLNLQEIRQMKYLSQVIDETLRNVGLAFIGSFREAKVDVQIKGYTIPKGWKVYIWTRAVHMDPQHFPNPTEFDPSRWDNFRPKPGAFIPFGGGSRLCPGSDLAKLEISIFLHYFLLHYKLERLNPNCPITYLPARHPADNCLANIIRVE